MFAAIVPLLRSSNDLGKDFTTMQDRAKTNYGYPTRDCVNVLHAAWKHASYFFLQNMKNSGSFHGNILKDYNAVSTISIETEDISTP